MGLLSITPQEIDKRTSKMQISRLGHLHGFLPAEALGLVGDRSARLSYSHSVCQAGVIPISPSDERFQSPTLADRDTDRK